MLHVRIRVILPLCVAASVAADRGGTAPEGAVVPGQRLSAAAPALLALGLAGVNQLDTLGPGTYLVGSLLPINVKLQVLKNHLGIAVRHIKLLLTINTDIDFFVAHLRQHHRVPIAGDGVGPLSINVGIAGDNIDQQQLIAQTLRVDFKVA